jgi:hypothetical protein
MASIFDKLKAQFERPAHAYTPTTQTFPDLDVDRLTKELRLHERGVEDGRADLPPSGAETLSRTETEIVELIAAGQKNNADQLENHLAGYRQRLIDLDFEGRFADISAAAAANLADLAAELQMGLDELHPLRRHLWESEQWREDFKAKHRLRRPAKLSSGLTTSVKVLFLLLLVLIELWVNGSFLSKNSDYGLVGGIIEAFSFATFNVVSAFFIGLFGVRGIAHRNYFLKLWGLITLAAYLVLALGINLGLAHYREVAGTIIDGAGRDVMARLFERPFQLDEFNSWLLFGIGLFFSLAAMVDGLSFTDSYFGFASLEKRVNTSRSSYLEKRRELIQALQDVRQGYEDLLTDARTDLGKRRTEHNAIVENRVRLVKLFGQAEIQLEHAANVLLSAYRDSNRAARSSPAPKRYDKPYRVVRIKPTPTTDGEWKADRLDAAIAQAHVDLAKLMGRLAEQFEEALARYRELDVLVPDKK